jgi:hypothetical protein
MKIKKTLKKVQIHAVTPVIDLVLGRTMSKKLMVFIIASAYLMAQYLTPEEWVTIAKIYIGSQAAVDITETIVQKFKHKRDEEGIEPGNEDI